VNPVRIFGQPFEVNARVETISGYSAHADQAELVTWARAFDPKRLEDLYLVHGELGPATTLQEMLAENGLPQVKIPARGHSVKY
jgi:metallo-beta-lactamase family protein